tara:strand:+ start:191 stop:1111 length:921 start_codon:yes stop_codon:yes gene_type:complete
MKLSHWHKAQGDTVHFSKSWQRDLFEPQYDTVYGSAIFKWTKPKLDRFLTEFPDAIVGGTGTTSTMTVEDITNGEYEHFDYSLYPKFTHSIGFSQRGCRLKCGFCVVPGKEGKNRDNSSIGKIWRGEPHPKEIILLDNDFFGAPGWQERSEEILDGGYKVCFNQGINIRLIHEEGAAMLNRMPFFEPKFKYKRVYTAWDNLKDEKRFFKGLGILLDAGIKPRDIMVYMLIGYWPGETMDDILYRFNRLNDAGVLPYPMVFDRENKEHKKFQRWVNRRYYQFVPWEEYDSSIRSKPRNDDAQLSLAI